MLRLKIQIPTSGSSCFVWEKENNAMFTKWSRKTLNIQQLPNKNILSLKTYPISSECKEIVLNIYWENTLGRHTKFVIQTLQNLPLRSVFVFRSFLMQVSHNPI